MTKVNYISAPGFQAGHWYKIGDKLVIAVHDDFLKTRLVWIRNDGTAIFILESAIPQLKELCAIKEVDVEINVIVNEKPV